MAESTTAPHRRIGLLGGTFDPPHRAHEALARHAMRELNLDEVWWIPAGDPWQKRGTRPITPAADRLEMVRRAVRHEPRFRVDDLELRRSGPSYAIDTVRALQRLHPKTCWVWILGEDAFRGLPTWKDWTALASLVEFAVARRPMVGDATSPATTSLPAHPGARATALDMPGDDAASTAIRAAATAGHLLTPWVDAEVARYIESRRLYGSQPPRAAPPASTDAGSAPAES